MNTHSPHNLPAIEAQPPKRGKGRPPKPPEERLTASERARRFRDRQEEREITVDRAAYDELTDALEYLRQTIEASARKGNPIAKAAAGKSRAELLRTLAASITRDNQAHGSKRISPAV